MLVEKLGMYNFLPLTSSKPHRTNLSSRYRQNAFVTLTLLHAQPLKGIRLPVTSGMPEFSKNPMTAQDLTKLTVPQLKAICKEKKLTAYSKLAKGAIIQKIIENLGDGAGSLAQVASLTGGAPLHGPNDTTQTVLSDITTSNNLTSSSLPPPIAVALTSSTIYAFEQVTPWIPPFTTSSAVPVSSDCATDMSVEPWNGTAAKRKAELLLPDGRRSRQKKMSNLQGSHVNGDSPLEPVNSGSIVLMHQVSRQRGSESIIADTRPTKHIPANKNSSKSGLLVVRATPPPVMPSLSTVLVQSRKSTATSQHTSDTVQLKHPKRFVPLMLKKANASHVPQDNLRMAQTHATAADTTSSICPRHLDFPLSSLVPLKPVTLPPSLSQRKRVTRIAVALVLTPPEDLCKVTHVSRLFRYAAYVSAAHRLSRDFSGRRLADMMKQYSQNATNMWPYLRQREEERLTRQLTYQDSFLGQALRGQNLIADRLWVSPDNVKQATIAVRFLLTRFFFQVSVGHEMDRTATINDVHELVEGEIWSIDIHSSKGQERLYVLEATCEVVGHPPALTAQPDQTTAPVHTIPLRADWSAYITQYMVASKSTRPPSLMERLKWTNYEEYDWGISKLWISRTQAEGEIGAVKLLVAERYILACVVSNSVSGRWMSATEMAQDFNGLPSQVPYSRRDTTLHLFLPAHHHVESLHFTSACGRPLHLALAVVQTPGREYYILKDNGMQVGCEETGIAEVWMQLLGCDASGRPIRVK